MQKTRELGETDYWVNYFWRVISLQNTFESQKSNFINISFEMCSDDRSSQGVGLYFVIS
jgi:hypothetical protein